MTPIHPRPKRPIDLRITTLGIALLACLGCEPPMESPAAGPAYEPCSDQAVQYTCLQDQAHTGRYTAVDDRFWDYYQKGNVRGCGLGISVGGEVAYLSTVGWEDIDDGDFIPYGLDTIQPIASVTKTLTAMAILRLIQDGELSPGATLGTPLEDLLPQVPAQMADITLEQLLNHSAGLALGPDWAPGYTSESTLIDMYPENEHPGIHPRITWWGHKENTASDRDETLAKGTGEYSNIGVRTAAAVVDAWSAHLFECGDGVGGAEPPTSWTAAESGAYACGGYEAYIRSLLATDDVPENQRMRTMCLQAQWRYDALPTLAQGYVVTDGTIAEATPPSNDWLRTGSSGWMMTIGDLTRMLVAIDQLGPIDASSFDDMQDPENAVDISGLPVSEQPVSYALGTWRSAQILSATGQEAWAIEHGGNVDGYSSWYRLVQPPAGPSIGVALLCNGSIGGRQSFAKDIVDIVHADLHATGTLPIGGNTYVPACRSGRDGSTDGATSFAALMADWRDELHFIWSDYLARADGDGSRAEMLLRRDLEGTRGGREVLDAYDRGDLEAASAALIPILEAR